MRLSHAARTTRSGPIDEIFAALARRPDVISFAVGSPGTSLLPVELLSELTQAACDRYGPAVLQYGLTQGFPPLLGSAAELLRGKGIHCGTSEIHITTGGSGALHGACMALIDDGAEVLVEQPSYGPALKTFRGHGAVVTGVESDEQGMLPDALDRALGSRTAFVYLLPTFQNPTGRTMPAARRADIAAVITRHDALVIEDDVYSALRYHGEPVPAFWSFAPHHTLYLTSLSKTFAPALRVGIMVAPKELSEPLLALKQSIDMQTSSLNQAITTEFLCSPHASTQLARVITAYSAQLDTLTAALGHHFPPGFRWRTPEGGMFLWAEGPPGFDAGALLDRALGAGVAYLPGSIFYADGGHANTMRLSFANVVGDDIDRGIKQLAELCAGQAAS